jgi:hypothetical protein
MTHHSAATGLACLAISLVAQLGGLGCTSDGRAEPPSLDPQASVPPQHDPAASPGSGCTSVVDASGLVCSTCPDDSSSTPECLPAECNLIDHCMRCTDPKGRTGVDCSIDYEEVRTGGELSIMPWNGWNLAGCNVLWGFGNLTGTTCRYPGPTSCSLRGDEAWHCLICKFPDGTGICSSGSEPPPDPLANLPDDLPAPGGCVNELGADGRILCTTCTHADGSATRSCHYPGLASCDTDGGEGPDPSCLGHCTFDGNVVRLCNSPSGPRPLP